MAREAYLLLLAKVPGLRVAARTSAFAFKGKSVKMSEIGREGGQSRGARSPEQVDGWVAAGNLDLELADLDGIAMALRQTQAGEGPVHPATAGGVEVAR